MKPMISGCGGRVPDEESCHPAQNLHVFSQPAVLGFQCPDLSHLLGACAGTLTAVDQGLDYPATHGLLADAELLGHDRGRGRERGVLALMV